MAKHKITVKYLVKNISVAIGIVLIWRGIWYLLDGVDKWLFNGSHNWTALAGGRYWHYYSLFAR